MSNFGSPPAQPEVYPGLINEYDIERFYRDAKVVEIYEATKEMEKNTHSTSIIGKVLGEEEWQ